MSFGRLTTRLSSRHCCAVLCLLMLAAMSTSGCATNRIAAAKLPTEWQAELSNNAQTLELVNIASPTDESDIISSGDVLDIKISAGADPADDSNPVVRVSDAGTIFLASLGHIPVEGMGLVTAEGLISTKCVENGLYREPQVTVTLKHARMNSITVIGAVKEPRIYKLRPGASDVLNAIVQAGGLAENAGTTVEIRLPGFQNQSPSPSMSDGVSGDGIVQAGYRDAVVESGPQSVKIDLISATKNGQVGQHLPDRSIVMVESRDPDAIRVMGLVSKPNQYDYPVGQDLHLLDAIALAGGTRNPVANKVYIVRKKPNSEDTILIEATIRKAKNKRGMDNPRLAPGDVVSVEQTPATAFFEALRLVGFGVSGSAF